MPSKKKKYNARFPASRIKKIMQTDEEVGKVAQAVPVIISRTLELFVESLLTKSMQITQARNAKTLTPSHMKQCILSENRFDFLKDLVKDISDANVQDDNDNGSDMEPPPRNYEVRPPAHTSEPLQPEIAANFYTEQGPSTARTPVIQYGPNVAQSDQEKFNHPLDLVKTDTKHKASSSTETKKSLPVPEPATSHVNNIPSLIPIAQNYYTQSTLDNLYIDEDYDN